MSSPIALVLDDVHVLHNSECRAAVSVLADHVPNGSRLVLAGRDEPPLQMARLRAEGRILEIGTGDLSLSREEASSLLRDAGVALGEEEVAELYRQTEGWPVGLYLAALYLKEGGSLEGAAVSFSGEDRFVSEFADRFSGSADLYATVGRRPTASVNLIVAGVTANTSPHRRRGTNRDSAASHTRSSGSYRARRT